MAKEGCDLNGNGYPYPYVLLTKDGTDLEDEKEYTVVICGFLKGMEDELNQQDTGIVGEYGKVGAEWSMEEGKFKLKVEIPCNTTATVKLPDGRLYEVGSGIYQFE